MMRKTAMLKSMMKAASRLSGTWYYELVKTINGDESQQWQRRKDVATGNQKAYSISIYNILKQ
jgi:hypothetical protein